VTRIGVSTHSCVISSASRPSVFKETIYHFHHDQIGQILAPESRSGNGGRLNRYMGLLVKYKKLKRDNCDDEKVRKFEVTRVLSNHHRVREDDTTMSIVQWGQVSVDADSSSTFRS
jgi:hypothetical protein